MRFCRVCATVLALCLAAVAGAQQPTDSAAFIIRLGNDTTAVERYVRTGDRLVAEAVQRSPSTMLHRLEMELGRRGEVTRSVYTVRRPAGGAPLLTRTITFGRDSAAIVTEQGGRTATTRVAAANAIPIAGPFYSPYELALMRAAAGRSPQARVTLLQPGDTVGIPVQRVGTDSMTLTNQFGEPMRVHVDPRGRLLHLHTAAFTRVERVGWVDLEAMTRDFAARDAGGRGLGPLSPRHAFRAQLGSANLWVDYSRPAMRGRPIWGALVPFGTVWRMGANDAAHFATDRPVRLGDLTLQPGTYTLFLLPTASGWSLIVNRRTGISGLEHDPAHDAGRVRLTTTALERPVEHFTIDLQGDGPVGTLSLAWDRTRATVPITVAAP